mgnify:CR=1 FL=1
MVNVHAITPCRDLRLRRKIMKCDEVNGCVYINDISFNDTELTTRVYDILSDWDFQSKIRDHGSILYDLIRDSETTTHLRNAYNVIESCSNDNIVCMMVTNTLKELGDIIESTDSIKVVENMIVKLKDDRLTKKCLPFGRDVLSQVLEALRPIRCYLEKLKERMLVDEKRVQDIVKYGL